MSYKYYPDLHKFMTSEAAIPDVRYRMSEWMTRSFIRARFEGTAVAHQLFPSPPRSSSATYLTVQTYSSGCKTRWSDMATAVVISPRQIHHYLKSQITPQIPLTLVN